VDWDVLESEVSLTGTCLPMQGPFLFHVGGSESVRPAEMGQTISPSLGLVGAGGSTATPGVPAEDWWMGGDRSATMPEVPVEGVAPLPRPKS